MLLPVNQRGGVEAGDFKIVPVRNRIGRAGFHAKPAKDAAAVVDVVDAGVALATAHPRLLGVLRRLNIDAVGRAGGGA